METILVVVVVVLVIAAVCGLAWMWAVIFEVALEWWAERRRGKALEPDEEDDDDRVGGWPIPFKHRR